MPIPNDYLERVYAGVLGKIIGVYLGSPIEGWTYERISQEMGEVWYYVHKRFNKPLVVTDDDIAGTFTFLRALEDYGYPRDLTPAQIGQTWLNYLIEGRTVLWWGGMGNSTEHTAYLRLKHGIPAPQSGSMALNSRTVAEQIGAQIFIDGWAMVAPGDPEFAADLAGRAASVSHDGEAVYGAQVWAAMEALAFIERDLDRLLDTGLNLIPRDCTIAHMIADLRSWHVRESDWHKARALLAEHYGYDKYGGNCHIVPNHGLMVLSLLYGDDDFQKTLMIVNTGGWDTDCNSGNVGCLMGIKNGLAGIEAGPDWRSPVADRLYLPGADSGRAITDAVTEAYRVANAGRALCGLAPLAPKGGARFHFELPGAVQGFRLEDVGECQGTATLENVAGHSLAGSRSLAIHCRHLARGRCARVATSTFIPPEALVLKGYDLTASPSLYSGQVVRAAVSTDTANGSALACGLYIRAYGAGDALALTHGPAMALAPGACHEFLWQIPDTAGAPIAEVGLEIMGEHGACGTVYLDYLTWEGAPDVTLTRPAWGGTLWWRAWANGVDQCDPHMPEPFRLVQNEGRGLLITGCREWTDYGVNADVTPHMARAAGLAARVQGMRRYYALLLCHEGKARLSKALDGEQVLAETAFPWQPGTRYELALRVRGQTVEGVIDGQTLFCVEDTNSPLLGGGVALICEEGRTATQAVRVCPLI